MIIGNVSEPIFRMCGFLVQTEELVCINQKAVSNVVIMKCTLLKLSIACEQPHLLKPNGTLSVSYVNCFSPYVDWSEDP